MPVNSEKGSVLVISTILILFSALIGSGIYISSLRNEINTAKTNHPAPSPTLVPQATAAISTPSPFRSPIPVLIYDKAAYFESQSLIKVEKGFNLEPESDFLVEAWVKFNKPLMDTKYEIVVGWDFSFGYIFKSNNDGTYSAQPYYIVSSSGAPPNQNRCMQRQNEIPGYGQEDKYAIRNFDFDTPKLVAVEVHNNRVNFYENGKSIATDNYDKLSIYSGLCFNNKEYMIGQNFSGYINDLRISDTARYVREFTPDKSPFEMDANTLALYKLNKDSKDALGKHDGEGKYLDFVPLVKVP